MALVLMAREHRDGFDELRLLLIPMLLEKALAMDAVRHANHGERAVGEMRQDERRYLREVTQQVSLGVRRLLEGGLGRPVNAVQVGKANLVPAYPEGKGRLAILQLAHDVLDVATAVRGRRLCATRA